MEVNLTASADELLTKFHALSTAQDVADLLEVDKGVLNYHLYILDDSKRYTQFEIAKKRGGVRIISAPATALKIIQRKLSFVLTLVYNPKPCVHGFTTDRCIVTNAQVHAKRRHVLNVDLQDFFPSITFPRVRGMFMAKPYLLPPPAATVLAQISCSRQGLPQGAPTSPIVSNMVCGRFDSEMMWIAKANLCTYTRYADDITFSTNVKTFPAALAKINASGQAEVGDELNKLIESNGFAVNPAKVRLQIRNGRQDVTGLTINQFPNVKRRYVRQIRAMLHAWRTYGLEKAETEFIQHYDRKARSQLVPASRQFARVLRGKIDFIGMVRGPGDRIYVRFLRELQQLDPDLVKTPIDPLHALLKMYVELKAMADHHQRGYLLEKLLRQAFELDGIPAVDSFRRNNNGEQIDGAFKLDGWYYLVECRWRKGVSAIEELDSFRGKVDRSSAQTMGLFLSIKGWSDNVVPGLKQNPHKCIILMNGDDLEEVLEGSVRLRDLLAAKAKRFSLSAEPFYSAADYLAEADDAS